MEEVSDMSLLDLIKESQDGPEAEPELVGNTPVETQLEGTVDAAGDIQLDVRDLDALGARIREIRISKRALDKEEKRLKGLINSHPRAKPGYVNSSISITGSESIDVTGADLLGALLETKTLNQAVNMTLSIPKIREIAAREPKVAKAITYTTSRKIKTID